MIARRHLLAVALTVPIIASAQVRDGCRAPTVRLLEAQATFIGQSLQPFPAPYSGPMSMTNHGDHQMSESFGAYGGACLTSELTAYLDAEMIRGSGISRASGVAAVTNGDVLRQGSVDLGKGPYIARAFARHGAKVVVDGRGVATGTPEGGSYVGPTILDGVTADMDIAREEVFGPLLSVIHAGSLDEAIEIVNASRFGNGASIFTESGASVRRYRHEVEAGMIGVNIGVAAPVAFFPFSGWKDSFLGDLHAHGGDAVEFFTRKKTVTSRWYSSGQGSGSYFVER